MSGNDSTMEPRIAVLVDADNVEARHLDFVLRRAGEHGAIVLKRAFGRFSSISGHAPSLAKHGFTAEVAFPAGNGKNAADLMLGQYALRLAERRAVEILALVSSDGDFAPIAGSVTEAGVRTIGFGRKDTPTGLREAVSLFVTLSAARVPVPRARASSPDRRGKLSEIIESVTEGGRASLARIGLKLRAEFGPGYARHFGAKSLTGMIDGLDAYRIEGEGTMKWAVRRQVGIVSRAAPPAGSG
jgi:hypothetical protein